MAKNRRGGQAWCVTKLGGGVTVPVFAELCGPSRVSEARQSLQLGDGQGGGFSLMHSGTLSARSLRLPSRSDLVPLKRM